MALPYAHHPYALAPPSSASAAAIVAAEAAGRPHHRFASPATPVTGDVRTDAAILAYNALAEAAYDRRQAAGPPPEAPPAPPAPSASLVESATRYIVKKLAYQESGAGRGAAAAAAPATASGGAGDPAAYLGSWEERMAVQKAELKEGLQGLKVQGGTVLEGCDVLVPGHKLVKLVVRAGGKDLVTAEGSEEVTRYVASHDPESVPAGGVVVAYFTVPPVMAKGEVVLRKPIELRCRVQASDEQRAAAVKAGMKPPGYEDDFRTFYLPRGTFGHALDRKRPAAPTAGSTGATTPRNPRTPRSAAKKKKASGAADFDAPCIARVSVSANGVPLTFWIEKEFIAGVGDLRDHVGKPVVACRDDLAALLIAAYSDGAESDHGSEVLTREEYASMCSETGIEEDFDAAKDKVLGGVTSRMLKRRAERHLREHADVLREIALSKNASRRATATHGDAVCAAKQAGPPPTMKSIKADLPAISAKLAGLYAKKAGGGLEELVANLVAPQGVDPTLVLAEAAANVMREKGKHYPGKTQFDLLVMVLYTMSGPDIDALMGYRDVPDYVSDREAWDIYVAGKGKERNKALFSEVNGLMRGAADVAACDWSGVARWVKTICHLHHLCVHSPTYDANEDNALSRGLAGLPAAVVDAHGTLSAEEHLTWTAPSSCAVDKQIAIDYIMGNAANAQKKKAPADGDDSSCDSIFFSVEGDIPGLPLSDLSKYPKEAEVLLPPLSSLRVKRTTTGTPTKGCLALATEFSAATTMEAVAAQVPNDAARCSRVLEQRSAKKNSSVRKMLDGLRHTIPPWLPTSPRPGFRGAPAPDAVVVADHHSTTLLPVVCQNVLSPTSPRRTRSLAKR